MQAQTIVERVLKARRRSSGVEVAVRIVIGQPYWTIQDVEAACPFAIEGLYGDLVPLRGVDTFDALRNAVRLVDSLLEKAGNEYEIYWPDGDEYGTAS